MKRNGRQRMARYRCRRIATARKGAFNNMFDNQAITLSNRIWFCRVSTVSQFAINDPATFHPSEPQ